MGYADDYSTSRIADILGGTTDINIVRTLFEAPNARRLSSEQLGYGLRHGGVEKARLVFSHPESKGITGRYLENSLELAEEIEKVELLLSHPNAHGITDKGLERALGRVEVEEAAVIRDHIEVRNLGKKLHDADAEQTKLILDEPKADRIGAFYLGEGLTSGDAKKVTLLLAHPNAKGISAEHLGKALITAAREGNQELFDTVRLHPNSKRITKDDTDKAYKVAAEHHTLNKIIPASRPDVEKMLRQLENHPHYRTTPSTQVTEAANGGHIVPAVGGVGI